MAPRETENNAYAKFWGDKQRTLWYVMVFLEWSIGTFCLRNRGNSSRTVIQITLLKYWKPITTLNSVSSKGSLRHHHDRQQQQHFHR